MKKTKVFRISLLMFALLFLLCSCNSGKFSDLKKVADRENYLPMTLSVSGSANGTYDLPALGGGIRGRGNSTWDFCEKKSYKLKLNLKVNLLGTGTGGEKDWALSPTPGKNPCFGITVCSSWQKKWGFLR